MYFDTQSSRFNSQVKILKEIFKKYATLFLERIENLPLEHITEITKRPVRKKCLKKKKQ